MENSFITGISGQVALQQQMDVIANNIANMNTPGYRTQNMVFSDFLTRNNTTPATADNDKLSLVYSYGQFKDTRQGPITTTSNPLDIAIDGPGYLGVRNEDGSISYARTGSFYLNADGQIVTSSGRLLASDGGGAITIPRDAKDISIAEDGTVSTDQGTSGRLMLVEFDNTQDLTARGEGLYQSAQPGVAAENSRILQGALEGSNVQPVVEMTRMIDVSRAYERSLQMVQSEHERLRTMIQRLTRNS